MNEIYESTRYPKCALRFDGIRHKAFLLVHKNTTENVRIQAHPDLVWKLYILNITIPDLCFPEMLKTLKSK